MIKLIAGLLMLVDHIGLIFFPANAIFRLIGRLSMPMYAFCVAKGIQHTKCLKKYFLRVLLIACVSQPAYMYLISDGLNICFTWLAVIGLFWCVNSKIPLFVKMAGIIGVVGAVIILRPDYGLYGLLYAVFYITSEKKKFDVTKQYIPWGILHMGYVMICGQSGIIQLFTLPSIILIDMLKKIQFKKNGTFLVRYFYPIHLYVLGLFCIVMG